MDDVWVFTESPFLRKAYRKKSATCIVTRIKCPDLREIYMATVATVCVWGGVYSVCARPSSYDHRPSHPYYSVTEHVGFSLNGQKLLAPSAKRREVCGRRVA